MNQSINHSCQLSSHDYLSDIFTLFITLSNYILYYCIHWKTSGNPDVIFAKKKKKKISPQFGPVYTRPCHLVG